MTETAQRVAVVTGASSGIGHAICADLIARGYKVYGISRKPAAFSHPAFVGILVDMRDTNAFATIASQITESHIDVLINDAGVALIERGLDFTRETFQTTFEINLIAPVLLTQALKNRLAHGTVITVSSISDRLVGELHGIYSASKAALSKLFETIALEEKEITFFTVLPSYVDTPLLRSLHGQESGFEWDKILKPQNVADLVLRLVTNEQGLASGAKVIVVNEFLKEDTTYHEDLWGYFAESQTLERLPR